MMARDAMYANDIAGYVHYSKRLHSKITSHVLSTPTKLQEGFWQITNWQRDHTCNMFSGVGLDVSIPKDDPEPYLY